MAIISVKRLTEWELVADCARCTAWKGSLGHGPSYQFKMNVLMSRHSPIESLWFQIRMEGIPYCSSVHFVRHHEGITHYVSTQRPDRSPTGTSRHELPQDAPVNHYMVVNAQEIIAISKKRLCAKASPETRQIWQMVVDEIRKIEPELAAFCQPECWWCGNQCPEIVPCGKCPKKPMPPFEENDEPVDANKKEGK